MALSKEIAEDAEFAKTKVMHSNLDEACKKSIYRLIDTAKTATNGLSLEEKV